MIPSNDHDNVTADFLRQMARDAFSKHMISTASSLAEEIVRLPRSTFEDQLFYASCLYYNQEHRRCLALLEHKNMLSAELLLVVSDLVRGSGNNSNSSGTSTFVLNNGYISFLPAPGQSFASSPSTMSLMSSEATAGMVHINVNSTLSTILLAAQCLTALEQYEDSVLLLESLIVIDSDDSMAAAVNACRRITLICSNDSPHDVKAIATPVESSLSIINPMAGIYNIAGKCYDNLDNIDCARKCYTSAVSVDPACIEAAETLVFYSHLSIPQKKIFFESIDFSQRRWLRRYYQSLLLSDVDLTDSDSTVLAPVGTASAALGGAAGQSKSSQKKIPMATARRTSSAASASLPPPPLPEFTSAGAHGVNNHAVYDVPAVGITNLGSLPATGTGAETSASLKDADQPLTERGESNSQQQLGHSYSGALNTSSLVRLAEYLLDRTQRTNEAYRFARQAYIQDPFSRRGLLIYIACLVELALTAELFYLGHELTQLHPKQALSWYSVGCYYWSCKKYELAQKHFHKCTKLDKRFVQGYIMLGHSLGAQEEREHAVSALRTACRLLPGDHRPVVLMAKELMKTNCISLALHLLSGALETAPRDPVLLNELGVAYLRLDREEDALEYLTRSVNSLHHKNFTNSLTSGGNNNITKSANYNTERRTAGAEIYCNYATVLRRLGRLERALQWYSLSIAEEPHDHDTHAAIGYTFHLLRRFDEAIASYHRALALHPSSAFCAEMLSHALEDTCLYSTDAAHVDAGHQSLETNDKTLDQASQ